MKSLKTDIGIVGMLANSFRQAPVGIGTKRTGSLGQSNITGVLRASELVEAEFNREERYDNLVCSDSNNIIKVGNFYSVLDKDMARGLAK